MKFTDLPTEWVGPVCGALKNAFVLLTGKAEERKKVTNVSDVLVAQIAEGGVQYVFGIPGTSTLGVVEAIRKTTKYSIFK